MKLYGLPGACSLVDHIALQWTGQPFTYEAVARNALKEAPYLEISPLGAVPAIDDNGVCLTQNIAILEYISEKFPQAKLMGGDSLATRSETRRWLGFLNSDLHKTFSLIFGAPRFVEGEAAQASLIANANTRLKELFAVVDNRLNGRDWLADGRSVADAYLYVVTRWAKAKNVDIGNFKNLQMHFDRMSKDPGVQQALKAEGLN